MSTTKPLLSLSKRRWLVWGILLSILIFTVKSVPGLAQNGSDDGLWYDVEESALQSQEQRDIVPDKYRLIAADMAKLDNILAQAPSEQDLDTQSADIILSLPLPDGSFQRFRIEAYQMLEPELAAKFPEIKNYQAWSLDDPTTFAHLDRTPAGFRAIILTETDIAYIDPYSRDDTTTYISYYHQDLGNFFEKTFEPLPPLPPSQDESAVQQQDIKAAVATGPELRRFRLAVAATGEYTAFHGGTVNQALAAINTTVNRLNALYRRELSVQLVLVNNNDNIIYTDANTDPYTGNSVSTMLGENQANLDAVIGSANYDIGHVLSGVGGGGIAQLQAVCDNFGKARGASGSTNPVGDGFDLSLTGHEIGHQFGANHTFNADAGAGSCTGNRSPDAAYEPGSGSTIMAYGGTCGPQNISTDDNLIFHAISLQQMSNFVASLPNAAAGCGLPSSNNTSAPTVEAGSNYTIPAQTPFTLSGSATDPDGDSLTYNWEEFDQATVAWNQPNTLPNTDAIGQAIPIFRSYDPSSSPSRTFPTINNILDGTYQNLGESLPTINRTMTFRLTARDGKGGVNSDNAQITVAANSGPFRVTSPKGATSEIWEQTTQRTINWDVANTTTGPVACNNVKLSISVDNAKTFSTLVASTPNDGSHTITVPDIVATSAYIKVECAGNIFFDLSSPIAICQTVAFNDDFETGFANWTASIGQGTKPWEQRTDNGGHSGSQNYWFIPDEGNDSSSKFGTDSYLTSTSITPNDDLFLRFFHKYNLDEPLSNFEVYHGGVIEIKVGDGAWTYIDSEKFLRNAYNRSIPTSSSSAIAGRAAFVGDSGGYVEAAIDLSSLVNSSSNSFQIRFRQANDFANAGGTANAGWAIDDVLICSGASGITPEIKIKVYLPLIIK